MTDRRQGLTDADFDALKRKRDDHIAEIVDEVCREQGWDRSKAQVHVHGAGECYCACPDGPCQHVWDGPDYTDDNTVSVTCSRCGTPAIFHDMRFAP